MINSEETSSSMPKFRELQLVSRTILQKSGKRNSTAKRQLANDLLVRLVAIGESIILISENELQDKTKNARIPVFIDCASMCALIRTHIDTALQLLYISDLKISETEWELRREVFALHEYTAQYRVWKELSLQEDGTNEEFESEKNRWRESREEAVTRIKANPHFQACNPEKQLKLLKGQDPFVDGKLSAVREAGFQENGFSATFAKLSSYSHGHPSSFFSVLGQQVEERSSNALVYDFFVADAAIDYAASILDAVCGRIIDLHSDVLMRDASRH